MWGLVTRCLTKVLLALAAQAAVHSAWIAVGRDGSWASVLAALSVGFVATFAVP